MTPRQHLRRLMKPLPEVAPHAPPVTNPTQEIRDLRFMEDMMRRGGRAEQEAALARYFAELRRRVK